VYGVCKRDNTEITENTKRLLIRERYMIHVGVTEYVEEFDSEISLLRNSCRCNSNEE
jgi:hypothetical protein